MSDWKAGDVAVRVPDPMAERAPNECSLIKEKLQPKIGSQWKVNDVELVWRDDEKQYLIYLKLNGQPSDIVFDARLFMKLQGVLADTEVAEYANAS